MTDALQGRFSYPGIQQWEDVDFTDISGISPSMCTVSVYPQEGFPAADGDITFTYGDNSITIAHCHIDAAKYVQNSGGQIVQVTIMDERWKWKFGTISGRYNFKNVKAYDAAFSSGSGVGFVDPNHEKKPQELASLLIQAMGYSDSDWDLTRLPNDARPEVNWTEANPAQELHNLADQFGLRIVPVRSTGGWSLVVTGEGNDLPSDIPYTPDVSQGFDPAEIPDWIRIVTAPTLYETRLRLSPVAKDIDGIWKTYDQLSYSPIPGSLDPFIGTDTQFIALDDKRRFQQDGTLVCPRELALQTVFKNFVLARSPVAFLTYSFTIPGLPDPVTADRIIISDKLVRPWIDPNDQTVHERPAFIEGTFWTTIKGATGNWPLGTRLDRPGLHYASPSQVDEVVSFNVSLNEDSRWSMVTLSDQVTKYLKKGDPSGDDTPTGIPELYLHCACQIRDSKTWSVNRYSVARWIGPGNPTGSADDVGAFVWSIIKDDIQPFFRGVYALDGTLTKTIDNTDQITIECNYYLDALVKTLESLTNETKTFIGLWPIDLDGKIQQVSYKINKSGCDTVASTNTEHDYELPPYDARRQRDARKNQANRKAVTRELMDNLVKAGMAPGK